ncbi:MAG: NINE protein [Rhizonema sp. NSF051]|nr:NINE protein [Rhizonema sp. NSF051]
MIQKRKAYLYWCTILFGVGGIHRIYCGKYASGILFMCTGGFFFIGQFLDLVGIPGMVDERNLKIAMLRGTNISNNQTVVVNVADYIAPTVAPAQLESKKTDTQKILEFAKSNGDIVTLSDCVITTGKPTKDVKELLGTLCSDGVMEVGNHPTSGIVIYRLS